MPHGHAPGHIRTPFLEAIEAYVGWSSGDPPPTVTREIKFKPFEISLAAACRLVWNCTDILPRSAFSTLTQDCDLPIRRQTYAAAARAILAALKAEGHDD